MASLLPGELLWRRVMPSQRNADDSAQSCAFSTQELCVHRAALTTLVDVLAGFPDAHVYEFTVQEALTAGASDVTDDRLPAEPVDHAMVLGTTRGKVAKRLRNAARRIHPPTP